MEKQTGKPDARKLVLEIIGKKPDVIYILSGGIVKRDGKKGLPFHTTAYSDEDEFGTYGGKARTIAGAYLHTFFPDIPVVTTSHIKEDEPTHAEVMAGDLIRRKVDPNDILLEEDSTSTLTEVQEMVKLAVENKWHTVSLVANDWQIDRIKEIYTRLESLTDSGDTNLLEAMRLFRESSVCVVFISAEDILPLKSSHFTNLINIVRNSDAYKKRMEGEKAGVKKLQSGNYDNRPGYQRRLGETSIS